MEASRSALADFVEENIGESHKLSLETLYGTFLTVIRNSYAGSNDRVLVPALEVFAFLLHFSLPDLMITGNFDWHSLFVVIPKIHFKSTNMSKLEAAIKIYSTLASIRSVRKEALAILTGMLLHPFPKVRIAAAEVLHTYFELDGDQERICDLLGSEDWTQPAKGLKEVANEIKSEVSQAY
ncbi:MAG: hypothetical protein M1816_007697 [Peltula sp. TS41687]|nr:MAG: hypothetical protein M1816_007697 [Peltula sp. TS41687]